MRNTLKKYNWVLIWAVLSLVFALTIHVAFNITAPAKFLESVWSAGDILTYTSTIALGLLAFWQNQKLYEESYKQEVRNLTIEKYVLFTFEDLEAIFYNEGDCSDSWREVKPMEMGYNGNKAFWKYNSIEKDKLKIKIKIKNIGDYPAVQIMVVDKNGNRLKKSNIVHSDGDTNDKRYILNGDCGTMIINIEMRELLNKKSLEYYLNFKNPFGLSYSQVISVESRHSNNKIIQVDAQCSLHNLQPLKK